MTPDLAKAALAFLERTTLRPQEINTFNAVYRALMLTANPIKKVKTKPDVIDSSPASK